MCELLTNGAHWEGRNEGIVTNGASDREGREAWEMDRAPEQIEMTQNTSGHWDVGRTTGQGQKSQNGMGTVSDREGRNAWWMDRDRKAFKHDADMRDSMRNRAY